MVLLLACLVGPSATSANTVSQPVSVAVPSGMEGQLTSRPVSVAVPSGLEGQVLSRPVSVVVPTGLEGQILSQPVSVAVPIGLEGQILGRPVSLKVQSGIYVDPDLLGNWQMEGNWHDTSGNDHHATGVNGPGFSDVRAEGLKSATFNGSNQYLDAGPCSDLNTAPARTLEAWVKPTILQQAPIVDKKNFGLEYLADGKFSLYFIDSTNVRHELTTAQSYPINGDWLHVVGVFKAQNSLELYVNGQLAASVVIADDIGGSSSNLFIGRSGSAYYAGLIDHVSVYRRALPAAEIANRYSYAINTSFPPGEPTVSNLPQATADNPLHLVGTREAGTSVWINGSEVAAYDETATDWQATVPLAYGPNLLSIVAKSQAGVASRALIITPILDNKPPQVTSISPADGALLNDRRRSIVIDMEDEYSAVDQTGTIATAEILDPGGQIVTGSWTSSGSRRISFTPAGNLADGSFQVRLTPVDHLGNSTVFNSSFEIDATPPAVPGVQASPALVGATAGLRGTMPADAVTVLVTASGGTVGPVRYPGSGQWEVDLDNLPGGSVRVEIVAVDAAGNRSVPAVIQLQVDRTAPTVPVVNPLDTPTRALSIELSGTKEADSSPRLNGQPLPVDFAATVWSTTVSLAEGENSFVLEAVDSVGNLSPPASVVIVRDTRGPTLESASPPVNALVNSLDSLSITFADTWAGVDLAATLANAPTVTDGSDTPVPGTWSISGSALVFSVADPANLAGGVYSVRLQPVDLLGNVGGIAYDLTLDLTRPTIVQLDMTPGSPHGAETVVFSALFDENMDTRLDPKVVVTGPAGQAFQVTGNPTGAPVLVDPFMSADGSSPDSLLWQDDLGNWSIQGELLQASSADTIRLPATITLAGDFDIQVDFDIPEVIQGQWSAALELSFLDGSGQYLNLNRHFKAADAYELYRYSTTGSSPAVIQEGTVATADLQGQLRLVRSGTFVQGYYWDAAAGAWVPLLAGAGYDYGSAPDVQVRLTSERFGADPRPVVNLYFDNFVVNAGIASGLPTRFTGGHWNAPNQWQGAYTFTENSGDGNYMVRISGAEDLAGNRMTDQEVAAFELDTVAPTVPTVGVLPTETNLPTLTLQGSGETGATILVNDVPCSVVGANPAEPLVWTCAYPLAEGPNSLVIQAGDAAGNRSPAIEPTPVVLLDTTPPAFTIAGVPTVTSENPLTISGTREPASRLLVKGPDNVEHEIVPLDDTSTTSWTYPLVLQGSGLPETYIFSATDALGNRSSKTLTLVYDGAVPPPLAAGVLSADGSGPGTRITLDWPTYDESAVADLAYYRVYRETAPFTAADLGGLTPKATVNRGTRHYVNEGLGRGQTYYFAVVPVDAVGNFDSGNLQVVSQAPLDTMAPEDVGGMSGSVKVPASNDNTVTVNWLESIDSAGDLDHYRVYVDSAAIGAAYDGYDAGTDLVKTVTSHTLTGLADNLRVKVKVTAVDESGHESAGSVIEVVTALSNPTGLTAEAGKEKVTLSWDPVNPDYLQRYKVYRLASDQQQHSIGGMTPVHAGTQTRYVDDMLVNGTVYQYAVIAVNRFGAENPLFESVAATPRQDAVGPVISGVAPAEGQIITAPMTISASATDAESQVTSIKLFIDGREISGARGTTAINYFWNVVAEQDGPHAIKLVAADQPGNLTEITRQVTVNLAAPSSDPALLAITSPADGMSTANPSLSVVGKAPLFTVVSLQVNGQLVASATTSASGSFSFPDVQLQEGANVLSVKASHRGGDSAFSAPISVVVDTGAPAAPINFSGQLQLGGKIQFTWSAGQGETPTGYNLYMDGQRQNNAPIGFLYDDLIPPDDLPHTYVVTALDTGQNESPPSVELNLASDRRAPVVNPPQFTFSNQSADGTTAGPGSASVALSVDEPLLEPPFLSLEPVQGSPIVIALVQDGGNPLRYHGQFTITGGSPHGPTTWQVSVKDQIGNRGQQNGVGPVLDVQAPRATISGLPALAPVDGSVHTLQLTLDEVPVGTAPRLTLTDAAGTAVDIPLTGVDATAWNGEISFEHLAAGVAAFSINDLTDTFGNTAANIVSGQRLELYIGTPPQPSAPAQLTTAARKAGVISLAWAGVADGDRYRIYRRPAGAADWSGYVAEVVSTYYDDLPPADGVYEYAVSAVRVVGTDSSEGPLSVVASETSDRTPPASPAQLSVALTGNGVRCSFTESTDAAAYNLYRAAGNFSSTQGLTPVATVAAGEAYDPAPDSNPQWYAVSALDALGNESPLSAASQISFTVPPPTRLTVHYSGGSPVLSWAVPAGDVQGINLYRNGSKLNQDLLPVSFLSYTDAYYDGGTVEYGVSVVAGNGFESPVRTAVLPDLQIGIPDGTSMRRGLAETIPVIMTSTTDVSVDQVRLKVGSLPESSLDGPFNVASGSETRVEKVAVTDSLARNEVAVLCTAVLTPASGTRVEITRTSRVLVQGSGTALEIFNEPLMRGSQAQVRLKFNNLGSARMDIVTSENGGPTGKVRVYLKDQDGNVLAQGRLDQRTGSVVNSGNFATARIAPGETFLSDPITFTVPPTAPYRVFLEAVVEQIYYHYQQSDQVIAPGIRQRSAALIEDVSYRAVAEVAGDTYRQGEPIVIRGVATSTLSGEPMPYVPVRIGVSVKGFDRFFDVTTDATGHFSQTFRPQNKEAGHYNVWAVHPDLSDRTVQDSFDIIAMHVAPSRIDLRLARGTSHDVPIVLQNLSAAPLTGLSLNATAGDGITAMLLNVGDPVLRGDEKRTVTLRISAAQDAPDTATVTLGVDTDAGLNRRISANIALYDNIPLISTSPSLIDTGLVRGTQQLKSFMLTNKGLETLSGVHLVPPSTPWMVLASPAALGDIPVGQSRSVGVLIKPDADIKPGVYDDRIIVRSGNHISYTYHLQVTVTSNAVGGVLFDVLNELREDVAGATITVQNQLQPELIYTLKTGTSGTVVKNDLPEGRYSYRVTAPGHVSYGSSFTIYPGKTVTVPVALEVTLVEVEWSVTEVTIEDRYEIQIKQTFETSVPTAVIVVEPPISNLPVLEPGEVYNGEFVITNYGLINAKFKGLNYPPTFDEYEIEVLGEFPENLGPMERVVVPYRITRRAQ
ncbi:LamG-like jellyroll fold domain-containing protein [Geothermobacter hydrogeniphilus]|nr:LamG-like jellyroll fold domain-containing protein [Geothermobacter hydrogeniphilus]